MNSNKPNQTAFSEDELVDAILDALRQARETWALLPPLPEGVRSAHIRILSAMERMERGGRLRVSDINARLGAALPNTTRFLGELAELGAVRKIADASDKRVVLVQTTPLGDELTERFVRQIHGRMATAFARIGTDRCGAMVRTLDEIHAAMQDICGASKKDRK